MKGLITSWLYCRKSYFITALLFFVLTCAAMTIVIPLLNLEENEQLKPIAAFGTFLLGFAVMVICGESLDKDLEDMLKTGFANYALIGGISKRSFVNQLLVRNLICCGLSLIVGTAVMTLYFALTRENMTAKMWLLIPFLVLLIHGVDFWITPLVIKFKNAEKAGFVLGLCVGVIVFFVVVGAKITDSEILITVIFDPITEALIIAALILLYIPAYYVTLSRIKRGDIC